MTIRYIRKKLFREGFALDYVGPSFWLRLSLGQRAPESPVSFIDFFKNVQTFVLGELDFWWQSSATTKPLHLFAIHATSYENFDLWVKLLFSYNRNPYLHIYLAVLRQKKTPPGVVLWKAYFPSFTCCAFYRLIHPQITPIVAFSGL